MGKTHLAVALGLEALAQGHAVYFTSCSDLLDKLVKAHEHGQMQREMRTYLRPKVLIVDEMGYEPMDRLRASLFFQLVSKRYEKWAIILTSNKSYGEWGQIFSDAVLAAAILDRLLHHSHTITIRGDSFRLKEKRKAGVLGAVPPAMTAEPIPQDA